jgi:hypothetical protein
MADNSEGTTAMPLTGGIAVVPSLFPIPALQMLSSDIETDRTAERPAAG